MKRVTHRTIRKVVDYQSYRCHFGRGETNDDEVKTFVDEFIAKHPGAKLKISITPEQKNPNELTHGRSFKHYIITYTEQKFIPFRIQARRFLREVTKDLSNELGADALDKLSERSDEVTNAIREVLRKLSQ